MKLIKFLTISILIFCCQTIVFAQEANDSFTIYLVRHAEKELKAEHPKDPPLTVCGKKRAESLQGFLKDVKLGAIYSTDYLRTRNTAQPTAEKKGIKIQLYDSKKPEEFAKFLMAQKENAFVVGHSNSIPALVGQLIGEKLESMDERIYDRIYQVVICNDSVSLHLLHSAFVCHP